MDIYEEIRGKLLEGEAEELCDLIEKAVKMKYPVENIFEDGLVEGINILAEKFTTNDVMVPEALMVSRALNAGLDIIEEYLPNIERNVGIAIIGTVEGDVHDLGKNIIKAVVSTMGVKVYDLGVNVSKETFIKKIKEYKPNFVMISALLTTTIYEMKSIIDGIKNEGLRDNVVIFVGGFPVTQEYAKEIGADYFTDNAMDMKIFLNKNIKKLLKTKKSK